MLSREIFTLEYIRGLSKIWKGICGGCWTAISTENQARSSPTF